MNRTREGNTFQILIWGAGDMGHRVLPYVGADHVLAFIDSDPAKIGTQYCGKPVIRFQEYQERYPETFILISPYFEEEIEEQLLAAGVTRYFKLSDCPSEFSDVEPRDILRSRMLKDRTKERAAIYGSTLYAILLSAWMAEAGYADCRVVDAYDISNREERYFNPELQQFEGCHRGESCFFIGNGPSLRAEDLDRLEEQGMVTFGVNRIAQIFDQTKWRPTYFAMSDPAPFRDPVASHPDRIAKEYSFCSDISQAFWQNNTSDKIIRYHQTHNICRRIEHSFSQDISRVIRFGATVSYECMQIAAYMGFSRIYLLGVDGFAASGASKRHGHFYQEQGVMSQHYDTMMHTAYRTARKYADTHGIKIYNATRGGYVEEFERVDFDKLFLE